MRTAGIDRGPRSLRRSIIYLALALVAVIGGLIVGAIAAGGLPSSQSLRIRGADISFTLQNEAAGNEVSVNGTVMPIETILADNGANYIRVRVWVDPQRGTSDLATALALARRAKAAGLEIILNLQYSDTWADRTNQQTPTAWTHQDPSTLTATVENYTRDVVASFVEQQTPVSIVQIGNEITHGMLWPVGQIYGNHGEHWDDFAALLSAASDGARAGNGSHTTTVMIDIDTGGDVEASTYFFDHVVEAGVSFDMIGLTYYPFWHGSLADLENNITTLAAKYNKDVLVAETSYPWTLVSADDQPNVFSDATDLPDGVAFPPTPAGQEAFYQELRRVLEDIPNGRGVGFLVWEPGWLPGVDASPGLGNAFDNLTLFDTSGSALPAVDAFAAP